MDRSTLEASVRRKVTRIAKKTDAITALSVTADDDLEEMECLLEEIVEDARSAAEQIEEFLLLIE